MSRRFTLLLVIAAGSILLAYVEFAFFSVLGGMRAVFLQIALLGVASALGTVLSRNLIHAALYLVAFFFLVACLFVLLEAEFLAAMQVLVYIGAVAVLMMFGIMLTRNIQGDDTTTTSWPRKLMPAAIALGLFGVLCYGTLSKRAGATVAGQPAPTPGNVWVEMTKRPDVGPANALNTRGVVVGDMALSLGNELMTRWVIPFEVAGLLLTAALVGAVALARTEALQNDPGSTSVARGTFTQRQPSGNGERPAPALLSHTN